MYIELYVVLTLACCYIMEQLSYLPGAYQILVCGLARPPFVRRIRTGTYCVILNPPHLPSL
jgi:hypothetical protein